MTIYINMNDGDSDAMDKRKEAQEAVREVQVAKLRSHVPDTGSPVVSRSPRAAGPVSRELRALA